VLILKIGRITLGLALRAVPRRRRFGAAVHAARAAVPLLRRLAVYRAWRSLPLESAHEVVLSRVLNALDRTGVGFDPRVRIEGEAHLHAVASQGRGVLLIGPHTRLSTLLVRHLHDVALPKTVVAVRPRWRITGTPESVSTIQPSRTALLAVRRRLERGDIICAMIDKMRARDKRTLKFDTVEGPMLIDDAMIRLAVRFRTPVLFTAARVESGVVVLTVAPPRAEAACSADGVTREFIAFLQAHVATVAHASRPAPARRGLV
jgi:lauroyl/myristoyl acyltransferase